MKKRTGAIVSLAMMLMSILTFVNTPSAEASGKIYGSFGSYYKSTCVNHQANKMAQVRKIARDYYFSGCSHYDNWGGHAYNVWAYSYWYIRK